MRTGALPPESSPSFHEKQSDGRGGRRDAKRNRETEGRKERERGNENGGFDARGEPR